MKGNVLLIALIPGLLMWQCTGKETDTSLKASLDEGIAKINSIFKNKKDAVIFYENLKP